MYFIVYVLSRLLIIDILCELINVNERKYFLISNFKQIYELAYVSNASTNTIVLNKNGQLIISFS